MWAEIVERAASFKTAVITGIDGEGYPYSVRCTPVPDHDARVLRIAIPLEAVVQPGLASLLYHYHNEQLWDLRSLNIRGTLERDGAGWLLRPATIVPDMDAANPVAMIRMIVTLRRRAADYLQRRSLPRPAVPWAQLEATKKEAIARSR
jgi:hypothetical protein